MSYNRNRSNIRDATNQNKKAQRYYDHKEPYMSSIGEDEVVMMENNTKTNDNKEYPMVYKKRWMMLILISSLNLLSDWTCFSVAPIATLTSTSLPYVNPTLLIVIFLFSNSVSTYYEPSILELLGLRRTIVAGSTLLMIGNLLKSGNIQTIRIYIGFLLVGLSQPLYQCTPAILSSVWFPDKERTLATSVALNSNQLGIGCAFFFGPYFVHDNANVDLKGYFTLLGVISFALCMLVLIFFENAPPSPPSDTARVLKGSIKWPYWRRGDAEDDASHITNTPNFATPLDFFLSTATSPTSNYNDTNSSVSSVTFSQISNAYFPPIIDENEQTNNNLPLHRRPGFIHSLIAFSISTVVINTVSASMDYLLLNNQTNNVGIVGLLFQLIIMMSSLTFGRYTDHSRSYYSVLLLLLLCGAFAMAACGLNYFLIPSYSHFYLITNQI